MLAGERDHPTRLVRRRRLPGWRPLDRPARRARRNWRVADEDANSVRDDIVQNDTRFDEVIHRFTKVSLEVALKTGECRSTSPGGATCWTWSKHDVAAACIAA